MDIVVSFLPGPGGGAGKCLSVADGLEVEEDVGLGLATAAIPAEENQRFIGAIPRHQIFPRLTWD
jgi:hypothetical protein